jgi:hypothetical protein
MPFQQALGLPARFEWEERIAASFPFSGGRIEKYQTGSKAKAQTAVFDRPSFSGFTLDHPAAHGMDAASTCCSCEFFASTTATERAGFRYQAFKASTIRNRRGNRTNTGNALSVPIKERYPVLTAAVPPFPACGVVGGCCRAAYGRSDYW